MCAGGELSFQSPIVCRRSSLSKFKLGNLADLPENVEGYYSFLALHGLLVRTYVLPIKSDQLGSCRHFMKHSEAPYFTSLVLGLSLCIVKVTDADFPPGPRKTKAGWDRRRVEEQAISLLQSESSILASILVGPGGSCILSLFLYVSE